MEIRRIPAQGETVEVTLTFTAEEWRKICNDASWSGLTAEQYIKQGARSGPPRRGC